MSGATLKDSNLSSFDLSNADLSGANLSGSQLIGVNLSGANLKDADLRGANLNSARLDGAQLEGTNFDGAFLVRASIDPQQLRRAKIKGARLEQLSLVKIDLSGCVLTGTKFQNSNLVGANFVNARLQMCDFQRADLSEAILDGAILNGADLTWATLAAASLKGASLRTANLSHADMSEAALDGVDLFESRIEGANFFKARGLIHARNLHTVRAPAIENDVRYFETVVVPGPEKFVSWEQIRVLGRLPLFGASYFALIAIPFVYYLLDIFNRKIEVVRAWATQEIENGGPYSMAAKVVIDHLHREAIPSLSELMLISTIFLGLGTTLFLWCPTRIREFSRDQWRDQLGHSLIHYLPLSWRYRWIRVPCVIFYILGASGILIVIVSKLWNVFWFIVENR